MGECFANEILQWCGKVWNWGNCFSNCLGRHMEDSNRLRLGRPLH